MSASTTGRDKKAMHTHTLTHSHKDTQSLTEIKLWASLSASTCQTTDSYHTSVSLIAVCHHLFPLSSSGVTEMYNCWENEQVKAEVAFMQIAGAMYLVTHQWQIILRPCMQNRTLLTLIFSVSLLRSNHKDSAWKVTPSSAEQYTSSVADNKALKVSF